MMMKILDLPLKAKWYSMIECGEKTEEYREIKPYWCKRLSSPCQIGLCWMRDESGCKWAGKLHALNPLDYTHVRIRCGYTKRTMLFELKEITIGKGNPQWGAPTNRVDFILKLGKRME